MQRLANDRRFHAYRETERLAEMFSTADERREAAQLFAECETRAGETAIDGGDSVTLRTANLARAVNFYARAFGFRLVASAGGRRPRRVVLHAARTRLALEEQEPEPGAARTRDRARLAVDDFDAARERVWDLGIAAAQEATAQHSAARDSAAQGSAAQGSAAQDSAVQGSAAQDAAGAGGSEPPRGRRRFVVRDPDGHEIEVVERRAR
jgi:catechol 2,3-dioxygenase-like lactoylglutathione lyase family enzyme